MTVENTYGRWKGRFRRFLKRVDMGVNSLLPVTKASCILHNVCEEQKNAFLPEWVVRESSLEVPSASRHHDVLTGDAFDTRGALAEYFMMQELY